MTGRIDSRLAELGIVLPSELEPAGNYVSCVITGNLAFISGQVPSKDGQRTGFGKLGREFNLEQGQHYARLAGLNVLTRLKNGLGGDLDRVVRCVKLVGFVNCTEDFGEQPKVINGASDLMVQVFGEAGRHARSAVGMGSLPFGIAVEVEGIFEVRG